MLRPGCEVVGDKAKGPGAKWEDECHHLLQECRGIPARLKEYRYRWHGVNGVGDDLLAGICGLSWSGGSDEGHLSVFGFVCYLIIQNLVASLP